MFGPEYARSCGIEALEPLGVYLPGDKNYPGKRESFVLQHCGRRRLRWGIALPTAAVEVSR